MLDDDNTIAEALVIRGAHIEYVGNDKGAEAYRDSSAQIIDLNGRTVIPGLIDAHCHLEMTAHARHIWHDLRNSSKEELLDWIRSAIKDREPDKWVVVQGAYGQEFPSLAELDMVAPRHPVVLRWSMHRVIANSAALSMSGITPRTASPRGTRIGRNAGGKLTGMIEEGFDLLKWSRPDHHVLKESIRRTALDLFASNGVTSVYELAMTQAGVRAYQELADEETLPVRTRLFFTVPPSPQAFVTAGGLSATGFYRGFGNSWVQFGGIKIFVDGWEAAQFRSTQLPGEPRERGILTFTYEELVSEVATAISSGLQVWMHAGGDEAQRIALNVLEDCNRMFPDVDHRIRIEHMFNELFDPAHIDRIVDSRGIPVPTPSFLAGEGGPNWNSWISSETPRYIYRTLLDRGIPAPGNSDCTGTRPDFVSPWIGIQCMVDRRNAAGEKISAQEAISVEDALRVYTRNSAYSGFTENETGSLEVGKLADLVILGNDPITMDAGRLSEMKIDSTIVGGRVVYGQS